MKTFSTTSAARIGVLSLILALFILVPVRAQDLDDLLDRMTLEEKVGQMTQLTLQAVSATRGVPGVPHETDMEALREAIVDRHVGSLLNVYDMARTKEEWTSLIGEVQRLAVEESRLGIPIIYGIDAVHGNNYLMEATIFPQNIGLAATWDRGLVATAARITSKESRSVGLTWNFAPVLDVGRQPLWSRFFETYGEDPYTTAELGVAAIKASQEPFETGYPAMAATGKHFLGYSMPLSGKDRTPAWIPERMLREIFLPPFQAAIDAGLMTVMINSAEMNGIPVHADKRVLTDLLRGELGFEGIAVTDWEDIGKLVQLHRVAPNYKEAVYMSVDAGIDMAMVPYDYTFTDALIELVEEGRISEDRIDESVMRILRVKKQLGLFDTAGSLPTARIELGTDEAHTASLETARRSMTLLKNDGILPHALDGNILVAGPAAASVPMMFGSWSYTWQGTDAAAYPAGIQTFAEAIAEAATGTVTVEPWGAGYEPDRFRARAYAADVTVLALGEVPSVEKPGDIESLELPRDQVDIVREAAEAGSPVVVVLFQNRPRLIRTIEPYADAILLAYLPGPFGGKASVDVLKGDFNPSGHLPFTYPRHDGSLVPYDHKESERGDILYGWDGFQPQYPFGHGLSYTTFTYENLQVDASRYADEGVISVTVDVSNTGDRAGHDAALLFVRDHFATVTPAVKELRRFESLYLEPGQSTTLSWELEEKDLSFIGLDMQPVVEPGDFSVLIEGLEATFSL